MCSSHLKALVPRDKESTKVRRGHCAVVRVRLCHFLKYLLYLVFGLFKKVYFESHREDRNVLEAASNGASASIGLVANIVVNLISFLAILEFINAILRWLGGMVGYPYVSFQVCSLDIYFGLMLRSVAQICIL